MLECPTCGGSGCGSCDGGQYAITRCPTDEIDQEFLVDMRFVEEAAENGNYPYADLIENSYLFVQVARFAKAEKQMWMQPWQK